MEIPGRAISGLCSRSGRSQRDACIGDKFGESLGGGQAPGASGKSPDFPGSSLNLPGSSLATSPEVLSLRHLTAIQRFPGLREAKPGGFQTRVFPILFGKGPDCVADPFGTVPRRCS